MRNYDRVHPRKPEGIEERKAYIVGGGIAGLSAAAFLVRDAQMPGKNITVYDQLPVFGSSMDAAGSAANGYVSRGERELEPYMECLWDLFGSIPSLYEEGHTVQDETRECNKNWEIDSKHRLWEQGFVPHDESTMGVTPETQEQMIKMMLTEEDQLEDVTIKQWFSPAFFQSQLWYYWSSMLAFQPYHSLIEMRRYAVRFMHQLHLIRSLRGILRTKYDQYGSLIRPLEKYLADHGVNFVSGATVTDMDIRIDGNDKTVTALHIGEGSDAQIVPVAEKDLVFFTNGSMTQNSTQGSMTEAPVMNRDAVHKGCFSLWEKLADKCPEYGHPEKFSFDPDKSNFVSCSVTVRDYPQFFDYLAEKTGNPTGKGGYSTFVDTPWFINYNVPLQPVAPDQPENVQFMWFYGLHANNCGLEDKIDEIMPHITAIPVVMPYITSQFMPRKLKDRPEVIPNGNKNLAFIGQFVELEGDVVFTVETSVRTAMIAVYRLLHLDRPITPLFQGQYDIRMVNVALKTLLGKDKIEVSDLPKVNPLKLPQTMHEIVKAINQIPPVPEYYSERKEKPVNLVKKLRTPSYQADCFLAGR